METPVRRVTRSQTGSAPSSAAKPPARLASSSKKKGMPRRALSDLTNDSPISGLMPSSMASNAGCVYEATPRSKLMPVDSSRGEDLLRKQVTNLLKKVERTGLVPSPLLSGLQHDPEAFESPMRLAAPTPANTPATGSWPSAQESITVILPEGRLHSSLKPTPTPIAIAPPVCQLEVCLPLEKRNSYDGTVVSPFKIREINGEAGVNEQHTDTVQTTTRTLQFDSPDKAAEEVLLTNDECTRALLFESPQKSTIEAAEISSPSSQVEEEDDCGWSVIVNVNSPETKIDAGSQEELETMNFVKYVLVDPEHAENPDIWARRATPRKEMDDEDYEDCECYETLSEDDHEEVLDNGTQEFDAACEELCRGISHISMGEGDLELKGLPEFQGKHVRFNYNSDDEIEEEIVLEKKRTSPSKLKLKGCPTPQGKHLRFSDDQDE